MNKLTKLLFAFGLITALCFGQATLTSTTLSAAMQSPATQGQATTFNVASATGFVAPSFSTPNQPVGNQSIAYVDHEAIFVTNVSGTQITGIRGYAGTNASAHASGAVVYVGPPAYFYNRDFFGSCTSTNLTVVPLINTTNGAVYNCATTGGQYFQWKNGTMNSASTDRGSRFCTGTVGSAETEYLNGAACSGATTSTARYIASQPGVIGNLRVASTAAVVGGSGKDVATVYKNGSATTITCTIAASGTACNDLTHYVTVAAGDSLAIQFVTATSDTAANVSATFEVY